MRASTGFSPQVAHTVHLSALGLPGYHLHAAYAGDWQLSPTEVRLHTPGQLPEPASSRRQCGCSGEAPAVPRASSEWERGGTL